MIGLSESNFIFGELQQESVPSKSSKHMTKQLQQSNHSVNHMKKRQIEAPPKLQPSYFESKLIIVQPCKEPLGFVDLEEDVEIVQLPPSMLTEIDKTKEMKKVQQNIIFPHEWSEEIEEEPQSSIRKLYKAMKREQHEIQHFEQEQKRTETFENEKHSYHEQSDGEQAEQIEKKTQVRSKSLRQLVLFKVPKTKLIRCLVKIASDSFFSLQTVFHFYLMQERQLLMTARKNKFRITSKYEIFGKEKQHVEKLAVARSNYSRTEYKLILLNKVEEKQESTSFSSGIIKISKIAQTQKPPRIIEEQKCYLCYQTNFFGISQQKIDVIRPKKMIAKTDRFSDIKNTLENCQFQRIQKFGNRLADKDHEGKLVMDFKDEKIIYSSRNMIIQNQFGEACFLLGKRRDDIFIVDVMSPFNFLQSFFIAICNLDRKLFVH